MKIYFVGSASCGKTTLARYVSDNYKLPLLTEVARMILSEKELQLDLLRSNLDLVDQYQTEIFHRQISEEKKYNDFVSDRSLDCLAYTAQHSRVLFALINSDQMKEYVKVLQDPKSFIFFIRPHKSIMKQDGVRETLVWDNIIRVDGMIKMLLEQYNLRYFDVHAESIQERVRLIDSILDVAGLKPNK